MFYRFRELVLKSPYSFICLFYSSIHYAVKEIHNFTSEARLEKGKTTVLIKWPTQRRATGL